MPKEHQDDEPTPTDLPGGDDAGPADPPADPPPDDDAGADGGDGGDDSAGGDAGADDDAGKEPKSALEAMQRGLGELDAERGRGKADADAGDDEADPDDDADPGDTDDDQGKAGRKGKKKAAQKADDEPEDPVDAPIPDDTHPRTQKRMRELIGRVKEYEPIRRDHEVLVRAIESTGLEPEAFAEHIGHLAGLSSKDPDTRRRAFQDLRRSITRMGADLIDDDDDGALDSLISDHEDLKTAVARGEMNAKHAAELAAARDAKARSEQGRARQSQQTATQAAHQAGVQALNDLEQELARDPHYAAKREQLIPALKPVLARTPPDQWTEVFLEAYRAMPDPKPSEGRTGKGRSRDPAPDKQPMRHRQHSGQAKPEPKSPLEALQRGLKELKR